MPSPAWRMVEHRGLEGLNALEDDWKRLYAEMDNPSAWHHYEAFSVYVDTLCPDPSALRLLALHDTGGVRAILPLEERLDTTLGVGVRVWGLCWDTQWRPSDAVGPEDDAREALLPTAVDYLATIDGRPSLLVMGQTPSVSLVWKGLSAVRGAWTFADAAEFRYPTDMSFDDFTARMKRTWRKPINAARRKFEAEPGARYMQATTPEALEHEFEHLLAVEGSGWKGERGSAIRQSPELVAFYRGLMERVRDGGHCEIHSLHIGDECIAAEFCVRTTHQIATYKSGYDERFARLSPGLVGSHKTYELACEDPEILQASGVSDAPWMKRWMPIEYELRRAYIPLRPVSGRLLVALFRLRYGPARALARALKGMRRRPSSGAGCDAG